MHHFSCCNIYILFNKPIIMEKKEIKERLTYICSKGYISPEEIKDFWNCYKELYQKEYIGNRNCQECIRDSYRKMIIDLTNE